MNKYRSHNCSDLSEADEEKNVILSGWLHRKRDHGNLLFIDLRDNFGITQCVIENKNKNFYLLENLKPESVLTISGKVIKREKGTENLDLKTGKIEIDIMNVNILSEANELPMPVFGEKDLSSIFQQLQKCFLVLQMTFLYPVDKIPQDFYLL